MLNERTALETMFNDLQREKNELKENYRKDLEQMERRQFEIMDRLQRLDDLDRNQADGVAEQTKTRLGTFKLPERFVIHSLKRPENKKITEVSEQEVKEAEQETAATVQAPEKPSATIAEKIEEKLEVADPDNGKYTGVKEGKFDGEKRYQCFYECTNKRCQHKGKRYIARQDIETFCHNCGRTLRTRPATSAGFPVQDTWNNFFVAGVRKTEEEMAQIAEAYANPVERIDKVLEEYTKERQAQEAEKSKTPSKPRRGRPPGSKNKKLGNEPAANKKSKQNKLADKTPAAQTKSPQMIGGKKVIARSEELIAALELVLEAKGPLTAGALEKEIKSQFGWEWANFYEAIRKALAKHPNKVFKDGRSYYFDPLNKKEMGHSENGQNDIQQEKAAI